MMDLPHVDICKLKKGTKLIVETSVSLWSFTILNPDRNLVEAFGTNGMFKKPIVGCLPYAFNKRNRPEAPDLLVVGWRFLLQFSDISLISEPVKSILVEGDGWKYEV